MPTRPERLRPVRLGPESGSVARRSPAVIPSQRQTVACRAETRIISAGQGKARARPCAKRCIRARRRKSMAGSACGQTEVLQAGDGGERDRQARRRRPRGGAARRRQGRAPRPRGPEDRRGAAIAPKSALQSKPAPASSARVASRPQVPAEADRVARGPPRPAARIAPVHGSRTGLVGLDPLERHAGMIAPPQRGAHRQAAQGHQPGARQAHAQPAPDLRAQRRGVEHRRNLGAGLEELHRHQRQQRPRAGQHDPAAKRHALRLERDLRRAERVDPGRLPARHRRQPVGGAGREDQPVIGNVRAASRPEYIGRARHAAATTERRGMWVEPCPSATSRSKAPCSARALPASLP